MKSLLLACLLIGCVRVAHERIGQQAEASRRAMDTYGCRQAATRSALIAGWGLVKGQDSAHLTLSSIPVLRAQLDGAAYDGCLAERGYRK